VGAIAAAAVFLPRVSVSPTSAQVPIYGSPSLFSINNTGLVPLEDVQPMLGICQLTYGPVPEQESRDARTCMHEDKVLGSFLLFTPWHTDEIKADHSYIISLQDALINSARFPISYADISIDVEYRVAFLPWRQRASFRFTTRQGGDSRLYWIER